MEMLGGILNDLEIDPAGTPNSCRQVSIVSKAEIGVSKMPLITSTYVISWKITANMISQMVELKTNKIHGALNLHL